MIANARSTKRARESGTMEGILPGESLEDFEKRVGDDIPEATEEFSRKARPISDLPELLEAINNAGPAVSAAPSKPPPRTASACASTTTSSPTSAPRALAGRAASTTCWPNT